MSTNVGTTSGSGRSGRFLGMAAAGLAVVIAAGFVFALNSGNEPTAVPAHPSVAKPFSITGGEANQVPAAARVPSVDPTLNIEKHRLEMAGVIGATKPFSIIGGEANQVPAAARVPSVDPTLNIEKHRLETAGVIGTVPSPTLNIEKYRFELQNAERATNIAAQRYEDYVKFLTAQALAQSARAQAMWEQRFDDLVERFENQSNAGTELRPLQGRS